jgi:predicted HAD superfamily phosphohydrolase YqeG
MKPAPFAVRAALRKMGVDASHAILIGDQVYTDVVAGNLAGVRTVLVRPQSTTDLWYTHIMRIGERMILHGRVFEGE